MPGFLKTFLFALTLVLGFVLADASALAQENPPADPISAYQPLRCQNQRDGSVTCTYPNGQQAQSCTSTTVGGTTTRYECQNPDGGRTQCDRSAVGNLDGRGTGAAGTQTICRVYDASGNIVTTRDTTNQGGRTTGGVTGSDGNTEEIDESNLNPPGDSCGWGNVGACIRNLPGMLFVAIGFIFLGLAGMILFLAGTVFNWVVLRTVFQFGEYFGTSDGMLIAWGVMRDIANIGLLFGFILMGVLLILNVDGGGHGHGGGISAKRAIPRLIVFAVLLNFSLFTTQFVIDVANAFGSSFSSLAGTECSTAVTTRENTSGQSLQDCANLGISGKILEVAGVSRIHHTNLNDIQQVLSTLAGRPYSYAVSLIMLSIFVLVTAFVLLAGAIMLIIRVVVLSFLMVTSPIGFAGMVIPGLSGIASKWWHTLISQSFFAPVYLLLIFISIKLTEGLMDGNATISDAIIANQGTGLAGNMQVVMVFMIVIGFMIGALISAQKLGAMGAGFATKFAAIPFAMAGRNTVGLASSRGLKSYEAAMGRARGSSNSFVRGLAKSPLGNFADDTIAGTLKSGKNLKIGGYRSYAEEEKYREDRGKHLQHAADEAQAKKDLKDAIATNDDKKISDALQKAGMSDIKKLLEDGDENLEVIARNLSPEKFAELMKDKDLAHDKKHKLQEGRFGRLAAASSSGFAATKAAVKGMAADDLVEFAKANPQAFEAILRAQDANGESVLSNEQREALEKAKGLTNSQRQLVKDESRVGRLNRAVSGGSVATARNLARTMTSKEKAKLDKATLTSQPFIDELTVADLKELQAEGKLGASERGAIKNRIRASARPNHQIIMSYLGDPNTDPLVKAYWT